MRHLLLAATVLATATPLDETLDLLKRYVAINTVNPPGQELAAARFLQAELAKVGVEGLLHDVANQRANVVARWRGNGRKRPVVLLHHLDVAPAPSSGWHFDPFGASVYDGWLYGRGAVDLKGKGAVDLVTFMRLVRSGRKLDRDVIFLAVADGEGSSLGSRWLLANRPQDLGGAEFVIDEGAAIRPASGKQPARYLVAIAQKSPVFLTLTFRGPAGHGSRPTPADAPARAVAAAQRLLAARPVPRLVPELRPFVRLQLAGQDLHGLPGYAGDLTKALQDPRFLAAVAARWPEVAAALTDTLALTRLAAGDRPDLIPASASLGLDGRLLPGTKVVDWVARVKALVADPACEITVADATGLGVGLASPADGDFVKALAAVAKRQDPGATVVPVLAPATTDSVYYRAHGLACYGFEPFALSDDDYARAHGLDERLPVAELGRGVERLTDLLVEL